MRDALMACAAVALLGGCGDFRDVFADGRLEDLCDGATPVCATQASCVVDRDEFLRGRFPGGRKVVVRSLEDGGTLVVRVLLEEMIFPGTEVFLEASSPDCTAFERLRRTDEDFFALAGGDRVLQLEVDLPERGDHKVEIFSDMAASYLMTFDVEY